jgi:3-hydroxybutyryl-CoA dehydrogenase
MKDFGGDDLLIGVVGAGIMGRGVAQVMAAAGMRVVLHDVDAAAVEDARAFIAGMYRRAVDKGRMSAQQAEAANGRISGSTDLKGLAETDLVIEAIIENLEVKQSLFRQLEELVGPDCILATNTSSLSVTAVAAGSRRPDRIAGFHFFNPVPLMKLTEVIRGLRTGDAVLECLEALAGRIGHVPVRVSDSPGFLVNHVGRGLITEGLRVLYENVTDAATVDRIMRECTGFRMGPFELMDLTGLDVTFPASEQVYNQYFQEPRLRPTPLQRRRFLAGLLGRKTGEGFYRYVDGARQDPAEPPTPDSRVDSPIWVSRAEPDLAAALTGILRTAGAKIDEGQRPGEGSVALVTPLGNDATAAAMQEGSGPDRTVAVDMLFHSDRRITIMGTPATDREHIDRVHALLAGSGCSVSVIRDSGGFVAQRIVATIVNIACEIAQQGIALPADIDTAARLGLGYPEGPLEMGDRVGPRRVLAVLDALQAGYGDPRYRPSPWLRRRAMLGMSLLQEEGPEGHGPGTRGC